LKTGEIKIFQLCDSRDGTQAVRTSELQLVKMGQERGRVRGRKMRVDPTVAENQYA
jgi:hypothetical protein